VMGNNLDVRVKLLRNLFSHLGIIVSS
jgi:hypothetical protein